MSLDCPSSPSSPVVGSGQGSGSYNVQAFEAAREKKQSTVNISIVLLDHTEVVFKVSKRDRGQVLQDLVFQHLKVNEVKYFGLQFPNDVPDTMRWLDPNKSIRKQFKRGYPYILFFRVKFYVNDVSMLRDNFTRYQLFLQIKLNLLEKRFQCSLPTAAMLSSYIVQSELGDFKSKVHVGKYLSKFKFIPNQNEDFEIEVQRLHKMHRGLTSVQAQHQFIKKAQKLEMYGVEIHHAKDITDKDLDVGVNSSGILMYQNGYRIKEFKWASIVKISFKRKQFYIQLRMLNSSGNESSGLLTMFHMDNYRACKRLWKSCVDFHSFYRLNRCMSVSCVHHNPNHENYANTKTEKHRFGFFTVSGRAKPKNASTDNLSCSNPTAAAKPLSNAPRNGQSKMTDEKAPRRLSAPPTVSYGVGTSGLSDEEFLSVLQSQDTTTHSSDADNDQSFTLIENLPSPVKIPIEYHAANPELHAAVQRLHMRHEAIADDDISVVSASTDDNNSTSSHVTNKSVPPQEKGNVINGLSGDLLVVKLTPDADGKYGFNVKGGVDQKMPVIISKVAPNSPASNISPALDVGDEVLQINGRDVSEHTHDQIVSFIRSTSEQHTGHLVLLISPSKAKKFDDISIDETISKEGESDVAFDLENSMQLLDEMLDSGEILNLFETLYRKRPGGTHQSAKLSENLPKNRYRDISPYDDSRVILHEAETDYINANFVNMRIPGTNWTNFYIASQGPLCNTAVDFWTMVWEQSSSFIAMLTTLVEKGRPKCYQYWPDAGTKVQFGNWVVESVTEEITDSFAFRDFILHKTAASETDEEEIIILESRNIKQMQYIAWPDHGVPDDSSDFLDFVLRVRQNRVGMERPSIVHCSAGIGRTGVLITMETAMCLIEANQPVFPIEIARTMRDQRAMMIQTTSQFKFVCEAILRVYSEGLARPSLLEGVDELEIKEGEESASEQDNDSPNNEIDLDGDDD